MVRVPRKIAIGIALVAVSGFGQSPSSPSTSLTPNMSRRGSSNGPKVISPQVASDNRVTLRFVAPSARAVIANGELDGKAHQLTLGEEGVWSVTIGPLAPDIYLYSFDVDGVKALDPSNVNTKYGYGNFGPVSILQVPGDGPAFYDVKAVPHGEVRIRPYFSKILDVSRTLWIYTPPNYEKAQNLPVLYLLHGAGDIESGWTMIGRANNILDNLISEGRAKPMVVVMPLGHAIQSFWTGPPKNATAVQDGTDINSDHEDLQPFSRDLIDEVIPLIESSYRVSNKASHRAIVGLSMGGRQTINVVFNRPELFNYVGLMSPAASADVALQYPKVFKEPSILNKRLKLLWMAVGRDDTLTGPGDQSFAEALDNAGIKHIFKLTDGRHEWTVWRHYLNELTPMLFR